MFDIKDSIIVNNISLYPYITEATFGFYDVWGADAGFNTLSGKFSGTFKGTYPKITVKFAKGLSKDAIITLTNSIFRTTIQTVVYRDPSGVTKTIATHKGDLAIKYGGINKHDGFAYDFVGNEAL